MPPFAEACWYKNRTPTHEHWLPHLACKAMGDVILELADAHPTRMIKVLCGHTHIPGEVWPRHNVCVKTGHAEYSEPEVQIPFLVR